jgi:hypothetical protein
VPTKAPLIIYLHLNPPILASQSPALGTNGGRSYMLGIGIGKPITVCVNLGSQKREGSSCSMQPWARLSSASCTRNAKRQDSIRNHGYGFKVSRVLLAFLNRVRVIAKSMAESLYVDFATRIAGGAQPWHHQHYSINVRLD